MFADEASNAARSEMLGVFLSYFDEGEKKFGMDFVSLVEVSSTSSEIVMAAVEKVMRDKNIDITKTQFSSLDGQTLCRVSMTGFSGEFEIMHLMQNTLTAVAITLHFVSNI